MRDNSHSYLFTYHDGNLTVDPASANILDMYQMMDTENITGINKFKSLILAGLSNDELFKSKDKNWTIEGDFLGYQCQQDENKKWKCKKSKE